MADNDHGHMTSLRLLVVEDNYLMAEVLSNDLGDLGCTIVGPVGTLEEAAQLARFETFDGAVLDINLKGQMVFPVAKILRQRGIPFVLLTGYSDRLKVDEEFRNAPRIGKPYMTHDLSSLLDSWRRHMGAGSPGRPRSDEFEPATVIEKRL